MDHLRAAASCVAVLIVTCGVARANAEMPPRHSVGHEQHVAARAFGADPATGQETRIRLEGTRRQVGTIPPVTEGSFWVAIERCAGPLDPDARGCTVERFAGPADSLTMDPAMRKASYFGLLYGEGAATCYVEVIFNGEGERSVTTKTIGTGSDLSASVGVSRPAEVYAYLHCLETENPAAFELGSISMMVTTDVDTAK